MKVEQIYELTNSMLKEITGDTDLLMEDLSNVVDVGKAIFDATSMDNYVKTLINHIGKVVFVNRPYYGNTPSVLMDGWEFGSVLQKVKAEMPEASQNDTWDLVDGQSYDPNIFYKPVVSAKFYNSKTTFEVKLSFTERQVKESFSSAEQLNAFISMLTNEVEKALTIRLDGLIKSTINSMTGEVLNFVKQPGNEASPMAVNLIQEYFNETGVTITAKDALTDPEFMRFAVLKMKTTQSRLSNASELFNMGGNVRFTPSEYLHFVMLNDFKAAADVYLQSDTYHKELTELPNAETVPFWQGSGKDFKFNSVSKIHITTPQSNVVIEQSGILGVMFDRDALGVVNQDRRVTSNYNPRAEFYTNFYKAEAGYFIDGDENFVVFYIEDITVSP